MLDPSRIVKTSCERGVEIDIDRTVFLQSKLGGPGTDAQCAEAHGKPISLRQGVCHSLMKVLGSHDWYQQLPYLCVQWLSEWSARNNDDAIKAAPHYFG